MTDISETNPVRGSLRVLTNLKTPLLAVALICAANKGVAEPRFEGATETVDELRSLYDDAGDTCRGGSGDSVQTWAGCVSRQIYGNALNDKGWCLGKDDQANAEMVWHECEDGSIRFPVVVVPGFLD